MTLRTLLAGSVNHVPYGVRPLIRHVPGLAAFQRWLVARHLSAAPFVHDVNGGPAAGLRFEVTLPLDKAIWAGTYEPEFSGAIARHVAPGDVCYDIGGYRGYMSAVMALNGASEVVVFEPLPGNQQALARLCELNPKLPIRVFAGAAGSADGTLALKIMPDASMGKLATSSFQKGAEAVSEIEVAVRSLDSMVRSGDAPAPDLLKVDVEGAELDVLRGASETLRTKRPKIFLEAHTGALETACRAELAPYGYNISRLEDRVDVEEFTRHLICLPG